MIKRVFVILGNECNLQCRYCLQHPISRTVPKQKISERLIKWLNRLKEQNPHICGTFYGGEPLLYFRDIVEIVGKAPLPGKWAIITNGRALTDEIVDFFNRHEVFVNVSWDGPNVAQTRGFNAFDKRSPLRRRILRIRNLGFTGVISSRAYPMEILDGMQELSREAFAVTGKWPHANLDLIFDIGIPDKSLLEFDNDRLKKDAAEIVRRYLDASIPFSEKSAVFSYLDARIFSSYYALSKGLPFGSRCGNGYTTYNVDLSGNLYACHNTREIVGTVDSPEEDVFRNVVQGDKTIQRKPALCSDCPALPICGGGCKLTKDEDLEAYCKTRKIYFGTLLHEIQKEGGKLL